MNSQMILSKDLLERTISFIESLNNDLKQIVQKFSISKYDSETVEIEELLKMTKNTIGKISNQ